MNEKDKKDFSLFARIKNVSVKNSRQYKLH